MRIINLKLKNIGAFSEANLNFIDEQDFSKTPVTLITGENGTGKTIILDAIRGAIWGNLTHLERNIIRNPHDYAIMLGVILNDKDKTLFLNQNNKQLFNFYTALTTNYKGFSKEKVVYDWILNYWTSKTDNTQFKIDKITAQNPTEYLTGVLSGIQPNVQVVALITYFDYLKSSENPKEREEGEFLMQKVREIIKLSLLNGEFLYVERKTLTPLVKIAEQELSLEKLSSGNLYLVQRLIALLGQMYAVYQFNPQTPISQICNFQGLLLIDEAENHLHPKWQKTFLKSILDIFPNLQIIATTHSPFVVASVPNAKVFVCEPTHQGVEVVDRSAEYSNKPIEEILVSKVFGTQPFSFEISKLLEERKNATQNGNLAEKQAIEKQLLALNPEYFSYLELEKLFPTLKIR